MIINHNMSMLFTGRMENINNKNVQSSMEKLSSGEKINRAGDDSAGLAISEKMRSQIRGLNQASRNVGDGISFIQVSEGYLTETTDILQRIRELAVQSANGVYTDEDRVALQVEVSQLVAEVDRIASQAQFNGLNMLTGRFARDSGYAMTFHIGANVNQNVSVYIGTMTATALGLRNEEGMISVASAEESNNTIASVDSALQSVSKQRADLGSYQNSLTMAQKGIEVASENVQGAESRIRDTDIAKELVEYSKNQILLNTSTAMLAQSQVHSQNVLALLR